MTLKQAVAKLGGPSAVAAATGIARTSIIYWIGVKKPPSWRQTDIQRIIDLAERKEEAA